MFVWIVLMNDIVISCNNQLYFVAHSTFRPTDPVLEYSKQILSVTLNTLVMFMALFMMIIEMLKLFEACQYS
jgi:hypothetical protein